MWDQHCTESTIFSDDKDEHAVSFIERVREICSDHIAHIFEKNHYPVPHAHGVMSIFPSRYFHDPENLLQDRMNWAREAARKLQSEEAVLACWIAKCWILDNISKEVFNHQIPMYYSWSDAERAEMHLMNTGIQHIFYEGIGCFD